MSAFDIADALRACLETAFEGDEQIPAEICHRPGDQVPLSFGLSQDECCSGLAWVRIQSVDPVVDALEAQAPGYNFCSTDQRITFELGVARCNPFGTADHGPTCAQWTEVARRLDLDRQAMSRAVCCLNDQEDILRDLHAYRVVRGPWTPLESSGLCTGGTLEVSVWTDCSEC